MIAGLPTPAARPSTANAMVAGLVATAAAGLVLFCGYGLALELGDPRDGTLGAWLVALTGTRATRITADALGAAALVLGNLAAHLVYGAALRWVHEGDAAELLVCDRDSGLASLGAERAAALGVLTGAVPGVAVGLPSTRLSSDAAYGLTIGGAIGSYFGPTWMPAMVLAEARRNVPTSELRD